MTSRSNARELDRLRKARSDAQERFARQMKLLDQIEATASDMGKVTARWKAQLAALGQLAGGSAAAAELSGLAKSDIEAAARGVEKPDIDAAVEAADPSARRRRKPAELAAATDAVSG